MAVSFNVDYKDITKAERFLADLYGQTQWITATAMTRAARDSRRALASQVLPRIEGGPTPWTRRGLIFTAAKPDRLRSAVGWQYGGGALTPYGATDIASGVPSGRYMEINERGGDRTPKSHERQLWRSGILPSGTYTAVATRNNPLRITPQGNLRGSDYNRILSRLRAFSEQGSTQNAPLGPGSRGRSARKRATTDFFILRNNSLGPSRWELGAQPTAIVMRTGPGPKGGTGKGTGNPGRPATVGYKRGFAAVLNLMPDPPNYERRWNIQSIAMAEYQRVFPIEWRRGLEAETKRRR